MDRLDNRALLILAVDGRESVPDALQAVLESAGHHVLTASSGPASLALAEQRRPDLILLDIHPPEMDGLQVLQILRQSADTARIPVLLLVDDRDFPSMEQAFQLGADDCLGKPCELGELKARVRRLTSLKRVSDEVAHLQELNRLKEDFIAVLSHELRTPLTSILGFTELLLSGVTGPLAAEQADFLEIVLQRARDLQNLIEALLEFNLIKAGQRFIHPYPLSLTDLVQAVIGEARLLLEQHRLELELRLPGADIWLCADTEALRRVLVILLDNAIKFTPAGGTIVLEMLTGDAQVTLRVSDSGIGISSDKLPIIFESFRQLEAHTTRCYGGLGLGLSIAKHLVELHHGRIWADSREEQGSVFTVVLPRRGIGNNGSGPKVGRSPTADFEGGLRPSPNGPSLTAR